MFDVKPGDKLTRMLAGTIALEVTVAAVEDGVITVEGGWTFDQETGGEIDEDLGLPDGIVASYLVPPAGNN